MNTTGTTFKMKTSIIPGENDLVKRVQYQLPLSDERIDMNELVGGELTLYYKGEIHCIHCGRKTKTSFSQGYCYPCFTSLPQTDSCILRPELCEAHKGISRDMKWSEQNCLQDHFVYLAVSSGLKVGVTRSSQIITRWIDQGAWKAIKLARTPNRHIAGTIEVELKKHMQDKTNWRNMLTDTIDRAVDLLKAKESAVEILPAAMQDYVTLDDEIQEFQYPVQYYPDKVRSINLDKDPLFSGKLIGIKGQYLIFEEGYVINIRKYGGYKLSLSVK